MERAKRPQRVKRAGERNVATVSCSRTDGAWTDTPGIKGTRRTVERARPYCRTACERLMNEVIGRCT